jgi:hypothetical protein
MDFKDCRRKQPDLNSNHCPGFVGEKLKETTKISLRAADIAAYI